MGFFRLVNENFRLVNQTPGAVNWEIFTRVDLVNRTSGAVIGKSLLRVDLQVDLVNDFRSGTVPWHFSKSQISVPRPFLGI